MSDNEGPPIAGGGSSDDLNLPKATVSKLVTGGFYLRHGTLDSIQQQFFHTTNIDC